MMTARYSLAMAKDSVQITIVTIVMYIYSHEFVSIMQLVG